jgi:hypothetical protein
MLPVDETRTGRAGRMSLAVVWGVLIETVGAVLHLGGDGSALGGALASEGNWRERRLARRLRALDESTP